MKSGQHVDRRDQVQERHRHRGLRHERHRGLTKQARRQPDVEQQAPAATRGAAARSPCGMPWVHLRRNEGKTEAWKPGAELYYCRPTQVKFTPAPPGTADGRQREPRIAPADRHGTSGDDADGRAHGDVAEEVTLDLDARRGHVGRERIRRDAGLPPEVTLQHAWPWRTSWRCAPMGTRTGCRRACVRRDRQLDALGHGLGDDLRANEVGTDGGDLGTAGRSADDLRGDGAGHLRRRAAQRVAATRTRSPMRAEPDSASRRKRRPRYTPCPPPGRRCRRSSGFRASGSARKSSNKLQKNDFCLDGNGLC